jgi:hypothetical protein
MADFAAPPASPSRACLHAAERPGPTKADPQTPWHSILEGALYLPRAHPEQEAGLKRPSAPLWWRRTQRHFCRTRTARRWGAGRTAARKLASTLVTRCAASSVRAAGSSGPSRTCTHKMEMVASSRPSYRMIRYRPLPASLHAAAAAAAAGRRVLRSTFWNCRQQRCCAAATAVECRAAGSCNTNPHLAYSY